jgi:hypothetical protein
MSKQDRNTQRQQDRQNIESSDLKTRKPQHDGGRNERARPGGDRLRGPNHTGAQTGSSGPNPEDLERQSKLF